MAKPPRTRRYASSPIRPRGNRLGYRFRDFAALRAAVARTRRPLVWAARRAAAARSEGERRAAAERACRDSAWEEAASVLSRFSAFSDARDRLALGARRGAAPCPRA